VFFFLENPLTSPSKIVSTSPFRSLRKQGGSNRVAPYEATTLKRGRGRPRKETITPQAFVKPEDDEEEQYMQYCSDSKVKVEIKEEESVKIEPGSERRGARAKRPVNYASLDSSR